MYTAVVTTYEDYYKTLVTTSLIEDQQEYATPDDMYKLKRLEAKYDADDDYVKVRRYSFDQNRLGYDTTTYSATNRPLADLSGNFIRLLPIPSETVADGLRLIYIAIATTLVDDTDRIDIPFEDRYAQHIVYGACSMLLSKGQQEEDVATKYETQFQVGLEKMKTELEDRFCDGAKMIEDSLQEDNTF